MAAQAEPQRGPPCRGGKCNDPDRENTQWYWINPKDKSLGCVCKVAECRRVFDLAPAKKKPGPKKRRTEDEQPDDPFESVTESRSTGTRPLPKIITRIIEIKGIRRVRALTPTPTPTPQALSHHHVPQSPPPPSTLDLTLLHPHPHPRTAHGSALAPGPAWEPLRFGPHTRYGSVRCTQALRS